MKIKRYEAADMQEALNMIKKDLGPDAVILSTRTLRKGGGAMGIFGRQLLEVTAAIEEDRRGGLDDRALHRKGYEKDGARRPAVSQVQGNRVYLRELRDLRQMVESLLHREGGVSKEDMGFTLRKEISELKEAVHQLQLGGGGNGSPVPTSMRGIHRRLISAGMDEVVACSYIKRLADEMERGSSRGESAGSEIVEEMILEPVREGGGIELTPGRQKAVALVGPTGVGKTTTAAKLAAEYALKRNKKVGFITLDTYRIAAVEQLKVYARIIGIPIDVVVTSREFGERLDSNNDKDLILIDTAGRSQRNIRQMTELKGFLDRGGSLEVHLLLSCTTKYRDLLDIVASFSAMPFHRIVFTKLDETTSVGNIMSLLSRVDAPLSYLTTGQKVPDDIEVASKERLRGLFFGPGFRRTESERMLS